MCKIPLKLHEMDKKRPKNHLKGPEKGLKLAKMTKIPLKSPENDQKTLRTLGDRLFDATLRPTSKSRGARSLRSPARCAREGHPWISRRASVTYYFYYGIPYALWHTPTYFLRIDIHHTTYHRYIDIHNWKVWRRTPAPPYFPVMNIYIPMDVVWWISIRRKYVCILSPMEICSTMVFIYLCILRKKKQWTALNSWKMTNIPLQSPENDQKSLKSC